MGIPRLDLAYDVPKPGGALQMPPLLWPYVCSPACAHVQCNRWRENALRRCEGCDQLIKPGEMFTEERHPITKDLEFQRHVECPK